MIVKISVPFDAWLGLMGAQQTSARLERPLNINYRCVFCGRPHVGVFLSAHPETLQIQVLSSCQ